MKRSHAKTALWIVFILTVALFSYALNQKAGIFTIASISTAGLVSIVWIAFKETTKTEL